MEVDSAGEIFNLENVLPIKLDTDVSFANAIDNTAEIYVYVYNFSRTNNELVEIVANHNRIAVVLCPSRVVPDKQEKCSGSFLDATDLIIPETSSQLHFDPRLKVTTNKLRYH